MDHLLIKMYIFTSFETSIKYLRMKAALDDLKSFDNTLINITTK